MAAIDLNLLLNTGNYSLSVCFKFMAYNKNYVLLKYSSPSYTVVKSHDTHMELQPYIYLWFPIQMKNDNIVSVGHMELQVVLLLGKSFSW